MSPWTGIFRKAAKPKPDGRIRWFGKLPTYADYYSSVTDEEWALEFVDWVLRGYEVYQAKCLGNDATVPRGAVAADHRRLPNCRLLVRLPQSGMTVLASLADYGGDMRGRPFPLVFYVGLPSSQCPGPTSDRVEAILRVFDGLSGLHREVVRFCRNPGQFESTFGDRELVLQDIGEAGDDSAWLKHAGSLQLAEWFAGAGLDSQMTAADWATRLAGLGGGLGGVLRGTV